MSPLSLLQANKTNTHNADCKSHTRSCLSFGRGCPMNISSKQKINTQSSTEAELVAINDAMALVLWCQLFIMGQGFKIQDNTIKVQCY